MLKLTILLLLAVAEPPRYDVDLLIDDLEIVDAIELALDEVGRPDLRAELLRICARESGGGRGCGGNVRPVTTHPRDSWAGKLALKRAISRGWIDPECYTADELEPDEWSTRGPFGLIAAFALRHIIPEFGPCAPPQLLDLPGPAALAAARHADACRTTVRVWSPTRGRHVLARIGACTCEDRTRLWVGPGVWIERSFARRRRSLVLQCGPQPPLAWWQALADAAAIMLEHVERRFWPLYELAKLYRFAEVRDV